MTDLDIPELPRCIDCNSSQLRTELSERCDPCALKGPCYECEEPEKKYNPLIDTEDINGNIERFHAKGCYQEACERWARIIKIEGEPEKSKPKPKPKPKPEPKPRYEWSRMYPQCVDCGTTEIPHKRHGFCKNCSRKEYYQNKKITLEPLE